MSTSSDGIYAICGPVQDEFPLTSHVGYMRIGCCLYREDGKMVSNGDYRFRMVYLGGDHRSIWDGCSSPSRSERSQNRTRIQAWVYIDRLASRLCARRPLVLVVIGPTRS